MYNSNRFRFPQQVPSHPVNKGWRKISSKGNRRSREVHDSVSDKNGSPVVASSSDGRELSVEPVKELHESIVKELNSPPQWYQMPFPPYDIQENMMKCIQEGLQSKGELARPLIVTEVPTGCGKTLALLCSVLQFQRAVRQLSCKEQLHFFKEQQPKHFNLSHSPRGNSLEFTDREKDISKSVRKGKRKKKDMNSPKRNGSEESSEEDSSWAADSEFLVHFQRIHGLSEKRRKKVIELDLGKSSALRKQFSRPPCTIFYATRTHGQLQQVIKELRNITGSTSASSTPSCSTCCSPSLSSSHYRRSPNIRMNILASRDRYCIHTLVNQTKVYGKLPHEGNNLGEICDKLVTLNQCPCVENYDLLGCRAIDGQGIGTKNGDCVWDIEDLVMEGVVMQKCPYYASRDIVFYADINLCTYMYLLDPVIRHECHFEGAVKNNSIIILDEAHNVPEVCEAVLSTECTQDFFFDMKGCLEAFIFPSEGSTAILSYPREFKLSDGSTLLDVLSFLHALLSAISSYFSEIVPSSSGFSSSLDTDASVSEKKYTSGNELVNRIANSLTALPYCTASSTSCDKTNTMSKNSCNWRIRFRQLYGIILSLGVTFNPFSFPLHLLSALKRWLVILRFLFQKPKAFALRAKHCASPDVKVEEEREISAVVGRRPITKNIECEIRCLDGSLAFSHLMRSAFRVILSSGTLTPFSQLSRSLGVPLRLWCCLEGDHVVPQENYAVHVLTQTFPHQYPLRCTYTSLSSDSFLEDLGDTILCLVCKSLQRGGVVVMVPNYQVLYKLCQKIKSILNKYWQMPLQTNDRGYLSRLSSSRVFVEPRQSMELPDVLDEFKSVTIQHVALFLGVYRGKSGEGLNFSDDMARMVFCIGVPFRPVTSWAVSAKRSYCGEAWYAEDALCAVNQALGRCLRHSKDFGAMILLDDRYQEEKAYQSKLSRWCRKVLVVNDSAVLLAESLQKRFEAWTQLLGVKDERQIECGGPLRILHPKSWRSKDGSLLRSPEEENARAFGVISGEKEWKKGGSVSDVVNAASHQLLRKRHRDDEIKEEVAKAEAAFRAKEHIFSCTAIKLLYEQCSDTKEVTQSALKDGTNMLESNFLLDFHD